MADTLYTVLEGIQVSREDILEAETFARQYLRALFPDLDLREGVALNDLVIRPFATLTAMLNKGLNYYFSTNSISGITDDSPTELVDKLMSNFFLTRLPGSSAVVRTRLFFLTNNRDIFISQNSTFSIDNVVMFKPAVDLLISGSELTYDADREEYFYDVDLISTSQDSAANIEGGDFIYHSSVDPYFIQASVLFLVQKAISVETNTEFLERAKTAVSTRNLINTRSIDSQIKETFNFISQVIPVGFGDAEMKRDIVLVQNPYVSGAQQQLHIGGKVDVYVNSATTSEIKQFTTDENCEIYIPAESGLVSRVIYDLRRATLEEQTAEGLTDTLPADAAMVVEVGTGEDLNTFIPLSDYVDTGLSMRQCIKISFPNVVDNQVKDVSFKIWRFTDIASVQAFLDDSINRVICADYLARSLDNLVVDINIKKIENALLSDAEIAAAQASLQTYFDNMNAGQTLINANLVEVLLNDALIKDLDIQLGVTYTLYDRNFTKLLGIPVTGTIASFLDCERTQRFVLGTVTSQ